MCSRLRDCHVLLAHAYAHQSWNRQLVRRHRMRDRVSIYEAALQPQMKRADLASTEARRPRLLSASNIEIPYAAGGQKASMSETSSRMSFDMPKSCPVVEIAIEGRLREIERFEVVGWLMLSKSSKTAAEVRPFLNSIPPWQVARAAFLTCFMLHYCYYLAHSRGRTFTARYDHELSSTRASACS